MEQPGIKINDPALHYLWMRFKKWAKTCVNTIREVFDTSISQPTWCCLIKSEEGAEYGFLKVYQKSCKYRLKQTLWHWGQWESTLFWRRPPRGQEGNFRLMLLWYFGPNAYKMPLMAYPLIYVCEQTHQHSKTPSVHTISDADRFPQQTAISAWHSRLSDRMWRLCGCHNLTVIRVALHC